MNKYNKYLLLAIKILVSVAFLGAGLSKLAGVEMMVTTYEEIGFGQWFRYLTGVIEVGSVILLWLGSKQVFGAVLLVCTMLGAVLTHYFILGPSAVPAIVLGLLSAYILYYYRGQLSFLNKKE
ncbi:DoxX family protein [Candidatus Thioglobus sp.]|jgi:putative oxidoreductase|nr:DoxX family protein [Candidatus Thioglobus sp.]